MKLQDILESGILSKEGMERVLSVYKENEDLEKAFAFNYEMYEVSRDKGLVGCRYRKVFRTKQEIKGFEKELIKELKSEIGKVNDKRMKIESQINSFNSLPWYRKILTNKI
jgi:hypothetical protein